MEQTVLDNVPENVEESDEKSEQEDKKSEVIEVNLDELEEVESQRKPLTDLNKHITKLAKIEKFEVIRIISPYSKAKDGKVHVMRVVGEIVETVTTDEGEKIEFRPNELFDMEEDDDGKLLGLPKGEKRKWQKLKTTLRVKKPSELIGKSLPMRINTNKKTNQDFLGFLY